MSQCPSCGGDCGYTKAKGCQYGHPDDKFRLSDGMKWEPALKEVERLKQQIFSLESKLFTKGYEIQLDDLRGEVTRLTKALEAATNVAIMYREQIKKYQQKEMMK